MFTNFVQILFLITKEKYCTNSEEQIDPPLQPIAQKMTARLEANNTFDLNNGKKI